MSSQRRSDENSDPDDELQLRHIKSETKNKPLPLSSSNKTSSSKKRLTAFERKDKTRFQNSGMPKNCLLKYIIKKPDDMNQPREILAPSTRTRSLSTRSSTNRTTDNEQLQHSSNRLETGENGAEEIPSQDSDLECLGEVEVPRTQIIEIVSESDDDNVSREEFEVDSPKVSDYSEGDSDQNNSLQEEIQSVISNLDDEELRGEDKIERWQKNNKRMLTEQGTFSELQPPPTKISKLDVTIPETLSQEEQQHSSGKSQESISSTPPLRIINVFTLSKDVTPSTSTASSSSMKSGDQAKKSILMHKEVDNPDLVSLMKKRNWRKLIQLISNDLKIYKLPSKIYVSQLIRKAILCEETRVSKIVQSESITLLEELMKNYPPQNGNGRDTSVKYYKEVLEKVFDEDNRSHSRHDNGSALSYFLTEVHPRINTEKNALQLLVLVTELVWNQYYVYEEEDGVIVNPPLFQYFLENEKGSFTYNHICQNVVNNCFEADSDEEFCIYLKWVALLARRLGMLSTKKREYHNMIKDFAAKCKVQNDMGLKLVMNIACKPFLKLVCEAIFDADLKVIRVNDDGNMAVSETDRIFYFTELSKTLLIIPADKIVTDQVEEVSKSNNTLTFIRTRADTIEDDKVISDIQENGRRKNVKGETRLHILCRPGNDNHLPDVVKHLKSHPDDVNAKDNFGNTPLHDCAKNNKGDIIVKLMQLYGEKKISNIDFLARNKSLETPMHLAATYCDSRTTEILTYFAISCGVLGEVLIAPNKNGQLPFQLVEANSPIKKKLTPAGYHKEAMLNHGGLTLDKKSVAFLEKSFELRKIMAWWSRYLL